jgi:hypothetical protein
MILKGYLARHHSLADLRRNFGHDLVRCWDGFKALFPAEDLSQHDDIVTTLNASEYLRYPDNLRGFGANITVGFVARQAMGAPVSGIVEPVYQLSVTDLDALMARLFNLCGINPAGYMSRYGEAVEAVERNNVSCRGWFPDRERTR